MPILRWKLAARAWIQPLLQDRLPAQAYGRQLLSPQASAPVALAPRGAQVCSCFNVSEPAIRQVLAQCSGSAEQRLAGLQQQLNCGSNCGSCLPSLRRLVQATAPVSALV